MSEPTEDTREYVELPSFGNDGFSALMDALAPEAPEAPVAGEGAAPGADPAGGASGAPGGLEAPVAGTPAAGQPAGQPAAGDGDAAAGAADPAPAESGTAVAEGAGLGTLDVKVATAQLSSMSAALEDSVTRAYQQQAYDAVREEYGQYFEALDKHPRLLVGQTVPAIGKDGMETLRDSDDAKEWQEAVKSILVQEVKDRAQVRIDESSTYLDTLHSSIDLFKNNADLIPGTAGFDRILADRFATMVQPYEVRVDGKLHGYSIPVQPIVDSLRGQLTAERATPSAPSAPAVAAGAPGAARPAEPVEPPQAAIPSKAGNSAEKEDFSTLFGTIGLPNLQI